MNNVNLTREQLLRIADMITEDNLEKVNSRVESIDFKETFYTKYGKRSIDILVSFLALLITLPINLIIMIVTFFDVGRPIFFKQQRVGKNGEIFELVKFRNMRDIKDENGDQLLPSMRVTKLGVFVRKTSLDELLNFYSIFKGDMSLIGPRPLVPQYYSRYNKKHIARYFVKPGLELPPRVHTSNIRTWDDQFDNDVWYVQNVSFVTDIKMMINLVRFTFNRKNSEQRGKAKRKSFMGYNEDGYIIDQEKIPEKYIKRVLDEDKGDK